MDDIVIEAEQRRQLHEVADLMLDIYRTLARMKYIEYDWIEQGPHDISHLLSVYRDFGLQDAVIYLYSVLPYIDRGVDFYGGGETADFRQEDDVEQGRNPLFEQEEEGILPPWMTALSLIGNHQTTLIYSTRDHGIRILAQDGVGSVDPFIDDLIKCQQEHEEQLLSSSDSDDATANDWTDCQQEHEEQLGSSSDSDDATPNDLTNCQPGHDEQLGSSSDDDVSSDESGGSNSEEEGVYEEMYHRPAGDVLRYINQLYLDLKEMPGTGKHASCEWDPSITRPLYSKHGWPGEQFDGNAFLVDLTRAHARRRAKDHAEKPLQNLYRITYGIGNDDDSKWDDKRKRIETATTLEDEWVERWRLLEAQMGHKKLKQQLKGAQEEAEKLCPGGIAQRPDDLPMWETEMLRVDMDGKRRWLERKQDDMNNARQSGDDDNRYLINELCSAEKEFSIAKEAYRAAKTESDGLYMGKSFKEVTGREPLDHNYGVVDEDDEIERLNINEDINEINKFIAQLPAGATRAKEEAEITIFQIS